MNDLQKPIYALTIEEYKALHKELLQQHLEAVLPTLKKETQQKPEDDIIFLEEAMSITKYKKPTIYSKVSRFEIPILSRKKPLTFSRKQLLEWIREGKPSVLDKQADEYLKNNKRP